MSRHQQNQTNYLPDSWDIFFFVLVTVSHTWIRAPRSRSRVLMSLL
uniref:Uncharacterized protein n=1 Tax=Rhizophora mucronata TaxID=61149 RepID=A0A2P2JS96_RHIMU